MPRDFTLIGSFQTIAEAEKATQIMREELVKIARWFADPQNHATILNQAILPDDGNRAPSPPEIELDQKYGVGFSPIALDWLFYTDEAEQAVMRFENIVFVSDEPTSFRSWTEGEPFEKLLQVLGAEISGDCFSVSCTAEDINQAQKIYKMIVERARDENEYHYIPKLEITPYTSEPTDKNLSISFWNSGDYIRNIWNDLHKLRKFLRGWRCKDILFQSWGECPDLTQS